ncbi:MAG: cytochrome P450 [Acidimicrobiia bacterium]
MSTMTTPTDEAAAGVVAYLKDTSSSSDPFPAYRQLREAAPVYWSDQLGYWIVTGHAEAEACLRDPRMSRRLAGQRQFGWVADPDDPPEVQRAVRSWLDTILNFDPPDHTRLRSIMSRAFTIKAISAWKARTEAVVDEVLARITDRDAFDLLQEVTYPIPEIVICELLGVPAEDHDMWKQWSSGMNQAAIFAGRNKSGDALPVEARKIAQASLMKWYDYFQDLVSKRQGGDGNDLVSILARLEEEGDRLSESELVGTLTLLIGAGHDTTANLIANGMLAFMRNPDQYALLRDDPSLAAGAVEEVLRYDGSARGQPRVATDDFVVGGQTIHAGDTVMVSVNAANRDPARFADPERFDITRRDTGHLAFASGIHFCLGAALARMEAEVAFRKIAQLDTVFELTGEPLKYKGTHGRNLTALPVRQRPA